METYIVNGKKVQHDTFDLECMELLDAEVQRVADAATAVDRSGLTADNYRIIIRAQCENILDAFDTVLGEGTSELLFGGKVNARDILHAWRQFVADVMTQRSRIADDAAPIAPIPAHPVNRDERRALERERRRAEAKRRAQEKAAGHGG